jgi:hypothetical protein
VLSGDSPDVTPIEDDYCCQQDGCNIQYLYGTGKLIGMTVGATVYDLDAALDPNDAVAICYEPEFPNFITYIREALDYIHTEEAASLEYCIVVECFPYDPLLDPADCLLGDTDNQERFVRISVINSTLTLEDPTWIKSGAVLSCNYPSVNGC